MKFNKQNVLNLTDKWIENKTISFQDLQNEIKELDDTPEKVAVPKFVAEWIELCKEKANLIDCLQGSYHHYNGSEIIKEDEDWLFEGNNQDVVARAWLDGYEVEKEPLYEVIIAGRHLLKLFRGRIDHEFAEKTELCAWAKAAYQLTEQEIKEIDERFWPFAVPAND